MKSLSFKLLVVGENCQQQLNLRYGEGRFWAAVGANCKGPWEFAFEDIGIHECWPLKSRQFQNGICGRRLAWLSRNPQEFRWKRGVYEHWEQAHVT